MKRHSDSAPAQVRKPANAAPAKAGAPAAKRPAPSAPLRPAAQAGADEPVTSAAPGTRTRPRRPADDTMAAPPAKPGAAGRPAKGAGRKAASAARRRKAPSPEPVPAPTTLAQPLLQPREAELGPMVEDYDSSELARAKAHWFFGEWDELSRLDFDTLSRHPDRGTLALLAAAAQQQLGASDAALKSARLALGWGCSARLVAQVLIAGVHNTLGRATALAGHDARAAAHFRHAVSVGDSSGGTDALMGHTRSVREITKLGLLPQAAALMDQSLSAASDRAQRPAHTDARIKVLESELELMRGALHLATERNQLYGAAHDGPIEARTTSQLGQDLWVLEKTGHKRGGYFVEFGATDGVLLSNTLLLERQFGWSGICAEPNPAFLSGLRKNRRCIVSDACVAARSGELVEFILADEYGGMAQFAGDDSHADKRAAFRRLGKTMTMTTVSLHDLLCQHQAPHDIDYLSIDTEGSEYDILRAFPFDQWRIRCITVEHNHSASREPIRQLLESLGYQRVEAQWDDWYFLHEQDS